MFQLFRHGAQDILSAADALLFHSNVTTARNDARANGPDMQIMNGDHAVNSTDRAFNGLHIHAFWNRFQEDVDGLFENAPRTQEDQYTDEYGNDRVGDRRAG